VPRNVLISTEKEWNGNPKTIPNALEAYIYAQRREKEISTGAAGFRIKMRRDDPTAFRFCLKILAPLGGLLLK
jgi:hypothetical protein